MRDLVKKNEAGQDISVDLLVGAELAHLAAEKAVMQDALRLSVFAGQLSHASRGNASEGVAIARDADLAALMARYPDRDAATTNDRLVAYSKVSDDQKDSVLVVVNLNPRYTESGWLDIPAERFGLEPARSFEVRDLLTGAGYTWNGPRNYVELNPSKMPAHIFRVRPG